MEQRHRDIIRTNYCLLAEQIKTSVSDVCACLYQSRIISERMRENILETNGTSRQKAEALLDLIVKRGHAAFEMLYTAILESELYEAADILNPIRAPHRNLGTAMSQTSDLDAPPSREEEIAAALSMNVTPPIREEDVAAEADVLPMNETPPYREENTAVHAGVLMANELPAQSASSSSISSSSAIDNIPKSWPGLGFVKKEEIKVQIVQPDSPMYEEYLKSLTPQGQRFYYTLQHKVRGRVLIVNNETFKTNHGTKKENEKVIYCSDREGSSYDKDNLEVLFTQLGFLVQTVNNQTKEDMEKIFKEECEKNHREYDCFILIILTHGHKGIVFGSDGYSVIKANNELEHHNYIRVKDIKNMFCSIKSLRGKPKLFFIQACRGDAYDKGVDDSTTGASLESGDTDMDIQLENANDTISELEEMEESDGPHDKLPTAADYLMALSTVSDYVSWRNPNHGSWFVQAIVYTFWKNAHLYDLNRLLTMANDYVSQAETAEGMKQVAEKKDTLRKSFCFFPGLHPGLPSSPLN
ncbi:unnamed protein product [Candidula unifasciata]|uniref:Uncharacterized protein n=1 Tax=Candidula unifasciata TaxID=100452 RepID=A0A8S3ZVZ8_9EUPU|nr:unnamed protein product [Candidula unifasciata]